MQTNNQIQQSSNKKVIINKSEALHEDSYESRGSKKVTNQSEELRAIPVDVAQSFSNDVVGGVMDGFLRQLLGQPMNAQEMNSKSIPDTNLEALTWKKKFKLAERKRSEEKQLYVRKQRESQQKLITIRQELQLEMASFTSDMASWAKEVEITTFQSPIMPSIYHEHFFTKLLSFVKNMRKRVRRSKHWLRAHNAKSTKKKGLWGMAKQGKSFNQEILFSGERAVSMGG